MKLLLLRVDLTELPLANDDHTFPNLVVTAPRIPVGRCSHEDNRQPSEPYKVMAGYFAIP